MRHLSICVFVTAIIFSSNALAVSGGLKSLEESIVTADSVIYGTITSINSFTSVEQNTYSVVGMSNVSNITAHGRTPLKGGVKIYVWGGLIEHPNYTNGSDLNYRYVLSYVAGAPSFNTGDKIILMLQGNGEYVVPLVSTNNGLLRIGLDGTVRDVAGEYLIRTETGYSSNPLPTIKPNETVQLIHSTFDNTSFSLRPGNEQASNAPIFVEEFVEYISSRRRNRSIDYKEPSNFSVFYQSK